MMLKEHKVIVIPGLGDGRTRPLELAVNLWRKYGLVPIIHAVGWRDGEDSFEPKLARLLVLIDRLVDQGDIVSLVGTSAGGSAALNAFINKKDVINRVINVCGRLRVGSATGFRSFESKSKSSPAFAESVKLCEAQVQSLPFPDRQRVMTVRAMFGDELVPPETIILQGASNTFVPTPEHVLSIGAALTVFSQPLIAFLTNSKKSI